MINKGHSETGIFKGKFQVEKYTFLGLPGYQELLNLACIATEPAATVGFFTQPNPTVTTVTLDDTTVSMQLRDACSRQNGLISGNNQRGGEGAGSYFQSI